MQFVPYVQPPRPKRSKSAVFQPDSLKLACSLTVLKHLHLVAERIEVQYGDKNITEFKTKVQGPISRPIWNRSYGYLEAKLNQVREHLTSHVVLATLKDMFDLALEIYNRFDK